MASDSMNRLLTEALIQSHKELLALSHKQAETLDRILVTRFDPPAREQQQPANSYAMPPEHWADALDIPDDREFLERTS